MALSRKMLLLSILAILLVPRLALANGGVFVDYEDKVYLPSQKAVVIWDAASGKETLILSTQIKIGDLADIAWVIPIPSETEPEIEEGNVGIFYDLAGLFTLAKRTPGFGVGQTEDGEEVEVIEVKEVDIYDITILKATGASVLVDWLNENGYVIPATAIPVLQEYCDQENFYSSSAVYFIANKIDLTNRYIDLVIDDIDKACAQEVLASIPPYTGSANVGYWVEMLIDESSVCEGADYETVTLLVELEMGIATPLKITFSPEMPFYPLKMSSINDGSTVIDVYVFSDEPVQDRSQLLSLSGMTENTASFQGDYSLGQKYVTYLSFSGDLSDLNADAWFESREYDRDLDPNYVSLAGRVAEIFGIVVLYVAYPAIFIAFLGFAVVGFVVVLKVVVRFFRRRREGRTPPSLPAGKAGKN